MASSNLVFTVTADTFGFFFASDTSRKENELSVCIKKQNSSLLSFLDYLFLEHSLKKLLGEMKFHRIWLKPSSAVCWKY